MSDKSFGDHLNRSIVKNPLLSSAVTGVSLDELSHKAVLLPAPLQEQITRLDKQQGSQHSALATPDHDTSFPSGDAFTTLPPSHPHSIPNDHQNNEKNRNTLSTSHSSTQSQGLAKSEDDFDVNEYIARLQGTRYVSAPLHSHLQEANANLPEESLEEINLNESTELVNTGRETQSITADIAQNFSQLPTVLPHVASAVFSSFSNMLSMRREVTPDVPVQQTQFDRPDLEVPVVDTPKDFGLPPKEPTAAGISNYRITSKKKYAPIPGLTHGGIPNIPNANAPGPQSIPPYFIPETQNVTNQPTFTPPDIINVKDLYFIENNPQTVDNKAQNVIEYSGTNVPDISKPDESKASEIYLADKTAVNLNPPGISMPPNQTTNDFSDITTPRIPIIPPPPMFSNQRRDARDGQTKSVLPPSVARRISANQPLIKQPVPTSTFADSIFVPTMLTDNADASNPVQFFTPNVSIPSQLPLNEASSMIQPDLFPASSSALPLSSFIPAETTLPTPNTASAPQPDLFPPSIGFTEPHGTSKATIPSAYPPSLNSTSNVPPVSMFTPQMNAAQSVQEPYTSVPSNVDITASSIGNVPFAPMFTPQTLNDNTQIPTMTAGSDYVPLIEPDNISSNPVSMFSPPNTIPVPNAGMFSQPTAFFNPEPEKSAEKPLIEPPKATGGNFRLTKKRPQYYAGPIEGVGHISNNVKPVIAPIGPSIPAVDTNYQGSLFTPEQKPQEPHTFTQNTAQIPDIPFDISRQTVAQSEIAPFDINAQYSSNLDNNTQSANAVAFDINVNPTDNAQQYPPYGLHSYGQYNTAFDFSRNTDAYEPPKLESKGFGIIGSLKTKLSSIDINKIQNTVTTFFDPAYNEGKTETAPETTNYAPQQYGQYSQSSFQVSVPSADNQYQYGNQATYDQSQYYQGQAYSYAQNDGRQAYAHPYTQQVYGAEHYTSNNQPNIPQNIDLSSKVEIKDNSEISFYNPATVETKEAELKVSQETTTVFDNSLITPATAPTKETELKASEIFTTVDNSFVNPGIGTHGIIGDMVKHVESREKSYKEDSETNDSGIDNPLASKYIFKRDNNDLFAENLIKPNLTRFSPPLPPAMSFFESPHLGIEKKRDELIEGLNKMVLTDLNASAPMGSNDKMLSSEFKADKTDAQNLFSDKIQNVGFYDKENSIIESTPLHVLENVSEIPLYGLSTMIADKAQELLDENNQDIPTLAETEIKLFSEHQPNFSLYTDLAESNKGPKPNLSISDVKNVLLIEPPQEDIVTVLKLSASSSLLKDLPQKATKNNECQETGMDLDKNASLDPAKDSFSLFSDEKNSDFFDHLSKGSDQSHSHSTELASDLSICETCREVATPDGKETEDVTDHLIENVMSSIQLSNPVEALLTERTSFTIEENEVACETIDDINRIAEDTIETIQGQQASELLDKAKPDIHYGWTTEQLAYADLTDQETTLIQSEFSLNTTDYNTNTNTEYSFNPNASGFFEDNSMFFDNVPNNASDEIKAEFKTHEDVLPRQMSIPTAPPEEDTKSDGTGGLDVHSIELDAKKDFPLEEEFIIEPSETDDDKIEFRELKRSSEDSINDTFTNRIEKFKNNSSYGSTGNIYQAPNSMASYFDTGDYAADTHYTRGAIAQTFYETMPAQFIETNEAAFRLPPGFEDELRKKFSKQYNPDNNIPFIPETSTQTKPTVTTTYSSPHDNTTNTFTHFGTDLTYSHRTDHFISSVHEDEPTKQNTQHVEVPADKSDIEVPKSSEIPTLSKTFGAEEKTNDPKAVGDSIFPKTFEATQENIEKPPLADPKNFFTNTEEVKTEQESFNRLASYFSMPPAQPDHSKSFFELSQSQNHYRHVTTAPTNQNLNLEDRTLANIHNLMQDLTSTANFNLNDDKVTTINYFSVEYDSVHVFAKEQNNLDSSNSKNGQQSQENPLDTKNVTDLAIDSKADTDINEIDAQNQIDPNNPDANNKTIEVIKSCEFCSNKSLDTEKFEVRKAADSEFVKEGQMSVNVQNHDRRTSDTVSVDFGSLNSERDAQEGVTVANESRTSPEYAPVRHHWFYRVDVDDKSVWRGFSSTDSDALERAYRSSELSEDTLIPTDGGRFDVNIIGRLRIAVYWKEKPTNVRRCSWFYKGTTDARYVPYTEAVADKLEEEFRHGVTTGEWHRRLVLPNNELVVMHGPAVMVHFLHAGAADSFSSPPFLLGKKVYRNPPKIHIARDQKPRVDHLILLVHGAGEYKRHDHDCDDSTTRPRVVRRGHEESEIEDPEPSSIDHLLLLCHGVGSACDMRFRSVEEVVEDFRSTSLQLLQSHYRNSYDSGIVNRVEVLPISWHSQLHVGEKGVDKRLNKVTLESIPRLRAFTNHTVLDALFYTSPVYHQTIIDTVCSELNRIYSLFKKRNPNFKGGVSLGGHSLGSVILYDLLCHQQPEKPITPKSSSEKSYLSNAQPASQQYPLLEFPPDALYALGSPIAIFECIRGVEALGMNFALPTCKHFFNIFHPYDPIAYRIEPLVNPVLQDAKPFLIPHHKGRKRMHLELKDTMVRVGADLKQKLLESLRTTWNKWKATPPPDGQLEKVVEEELEKEQLCDETKEETATDSTTPEMLGKLNCGRRIDYVLQEAPLEMINEYLFAMSSHVGYWESEDTMLLMLREIYNALGVPPDCSVPQHNMTVTRTRQDHATIVNEKEHASTSREHNL